jgi:translation initiation factor IF-3
MRISRKKRPDKPLIPHFALNEFITAPEVRVLDKDNGNLGILKIADAVQQARDAGMDLVEINPKADPPVCKLVEFTKFKYQKEKEAKKQKANSHESEIKGIRLSVRIGEHDMEIRLKQAEGFLDRGDKAKIEIILRGRENARPDLAFGVLNDFYKKMQTKMDLRLEQEPAKQGNKVTMIIAKK